MTIKTKCVYDEPVPDDGYRVLIMRKPVWINKSYKEFRKVDGGTKRHPRHLIVLSPSETLLAAYQNHIINWDTFEECFRAEQKNDPASKEAIHALREKSKVMNVTLLCQEKEGENCHRHIVKDMILNGFG